MEGKEKGFSNTAETTAACVIYESGRKFALTGLVVAEKRSKLLWLCFPKKGGREGEKVVVTESRFYRRFKICWIVIGPGELGMLPGSLAMVADAA